MAQALHSRKLDAMLITFLIGIAVGVFIKKMYDEHGLGVIKVSREFDYYSDAREWLNSLKMWFEQHPTEYTLVQAKIGDGFCDIHTVNLKYKSLCGKTLVFNMANLKEPVKELDLKIVNNQ